MKHLAIRLPLVLLVFFSALIIRGQSLPNQKLITGVEIAGVPKEVQSQYTVKIYQNTLKVYFDTTSKGVTHYRIIKSNEQDNEPLEWIKANENYALFTDLPYGYYILEAAHLEDNKVVQQQKIGFKITLIWWQSWAMFIFILLVISILIFWKDVFDFKKHIDFEKQNKKISELELRTLQLQMNPHFVFNALNSIQSYIITNDTLKANEYLTKFANLIRLFLESSRKKSISVSEEKRLLYLYCEIEKLRFEDKFDFEITVGPNVNVYMEIPTMMIQPFVENAINHGLRYKKESGMLSISFRQNEKYIICEIKDNGVGRKMSQKYKEQSKKAYTPQGIQIIKERKQTLNYLNDTNIQFYIEDAYINSDESNQSHENFNVGTLVTIKFPILI